MIYLVICLFLVVLSESFGLIHFREDFNHIEDSYLRWKSDLTSYNFVKLSTNQTFHVQNKNVYLIAALFNPIVFQHQSAIYIQFETLVNDYEFKSVIVKLDNRFNDFGLEIKLDFQDCIKLILSIGFSINNQSQIILSKNIKICDYQLNIWHLITIKLFRNKLYSIGINENIIIHNSVISDFKPISPNLNKKCVNKIKVIVNFCSYINPYRFSPGKCDEIDECLNQLHNYNDIYQTFYRAFNIFKFIEDSNSISLQINALHTHMFVDNIIVSSDKRALEKWTTQTYYPKLRKNASEVIRWYEKLAKQAQNKPVLWILYVCIISLPLTYILITISTPNSYKETTDESILLDDEVNEEMENNTID